MDKHTFGFHDWNRWEQYEAHGTHTYIGIIYPKEVRGKTFPITEQRQRRDCRICGKVQDESINDG